MAILLQRIDFLLCSTFVGTKTLLLLFIYQSNCNSFQSSTLDQIVWYSLTAICAFCFAFLPAKNKQTDYPKNLWIITTVWVIGGLFFIFGSKTGIFWIRVLGIVLISVGSSYIKCDWISLSYNLPFHKLFYVLAISQILTYGIALFIPCIPNLIQNIILLTAPFIFCYLQALMHIRPLNTAKTPESRIIGNNRAILFSILLYATITSMLCMPDPASSYTNFSIILSFIVSLLMIALWKKRSLLNTLSLLRIIIIIISLFMLIASFTLGNNILSSSLIWTASCLLSFSVLMYRPSSSGKNRAFPTILAFGLMMLGNALGKILGYGINGIDSFGVESSMALSSSFIVISLVGLDCFHKKKEVPVQSKKTSAKKICMDFKSLYDLTSAEAEVLMELLKGHTLQHIADTRYVSYNTVKTQCASIYSKLGVHSRQELLDNYSNQAYQK